LANQDHVNKLKEGAASWNHWREQNQDIFPNLSFTGLNMEDLSGANLNSVDLSKANLSRANLNNASLINAKLNRADLLNANLSGANFWGASLSNANLSGSNLSGAKLIRAELFGTNLARAILTDTDFDQAKIRDTIFADLDLSRTRNLETARYEGPSTIGIDTLHKSGGKIPDEFLIGCGVPEEFITPSQQPSKFYNCFISYSHKDLSFAKRLYAELQRIGIRCWYDEHDLPAGHDIDDEVALGIQRCEKVLLCASKESLASLWVAKEIKTALQKEYRQWQEHSERIHILIPINLDNYIFSNEWQSGNAVEIRSLNAVDFTGWENDNEKFKEGIRKIVSALRH
jgi:uncharacterized protein YjbI with pentapeptide repeats